jgi:phosphoribosylformylglycinamidine synthase
MKCGVVVFPGSNCDHDAYHIVKHQFNQDVRFVWHKDTSLGDLDLVILPGGFSYGDYLRPGAIAKFSPIMKSVMEFAGRGGRVLGICNGFQILVEAGLLPGALMRNRLQRFICKYVHLRVENPDTPFTRACGDKTVLQIPIAHADGNYHVAPDELAQMKANGQIVFRYCSADGKVSDADNPNGSLENIAGVVNREKTVLGMMPHPERCADPLWDRLDGRLLFQSLIDHS